MRSRLAIARTSWREVLLQGPHDAGRRCQPDPIPQLAARDDAQRVPGSFLADDAGEPAGGVKAMLLGPYASFIVASYLLTGAVVLILIAWIALDYRNQRQRLREFDERGVIRRSGRNAADVA